MHSERGHTAIVVLEDHLESRTNQIVVLWVLWLYIRLAIPNQNLLL